MVAATAAPILILAVGLAMYGLRGSISYFYTPAQAIDCFLRTRMDVLSIGPFILYKTENQHLSENRAAFAEHT